MFQDICMDALMQRHGHITLGGDIKTVSNSSSSSSSGGGYCCSVVVDVTGDISSSIKHTCGMRFLSM